MDQITLRGIPADVKRVIRQESKRNNQSLNKTIISMLASAAGLRDKTKTKGSTIGHDLDAYFGLWTQEEAEEFDARIEEVFEQIDVDLWK